MHCGRCTGPGVFPGQYRSHHLENRLTRQSDGASVSDANEVVVGMLKISADGNQEKFAQNFGQAIEKLGVTGLPSGPEGTLYAACLTGVMQVKTDGTFTRLINPVVVKDCDQDAPTCFLRGLDVDSHGTVYAAACRCRCVVKISPGGKVETVLKAEGWSWATAVLGREADRLWDILAYPLE
ncbi:MAG TPA: hypothetical protein VM260_23080 [Pirellula sp.]|nr:hypothetical protein [Pirellula sp.]